MALTFAEKVEIRVKVWLRNNADRFPTAELLAEEAVWYFNVWTRDGEVPTWLMDEAKELKK